MRDWQRLKEEWLNDPEFRNHYERNQVAMDISRAITDGRVRKHWTQENLAKRSKVPLSKIRKYEELGEMPPWEHLKRIAEALGCFVRLKFEPKTSPQ